MKKSLGRGLGAILGEVTDVYESEVPTDTQKIKEIRIDHIRPNPFQPRKSFDEVALNELAESIKKHGLLQPIVVIEDIDGYILVAGERRLRASKIAGHKKIKAIIAKIDPRRQRELALIENIQREDLNPLELAHSYKELIDEYKITHEELSEIVHKSRAQITNTLRLLMLSAYAQEALKYGKITQGHAKMLVGLDPKQQKIVVDSIVGQGLSVREVEALAASFKSEKPSSKKETPPLTPPINLSKLKETLRACGFKARTAHNKLTVEFRDSEEVDEFLKNFSKTPPSFN